MGGYKKYQHIEKLGFDGVANVLFGNVYVFPKIDGTNGQVWGNINQVLGYGSRNRELSKENDNAGFMQAMSNNELFFKDFIAYLCNKCEYDEVHIFGEWLVPHTIKTYRDNAWRKFYIFDVLGIKGEKEEYINYSIYSNLLENMELPENIDYIPPLRIFSNPEEDQIMACLEMNDYLVNDGVGEGIVLKNYDYKNKYGRITWAKVVRNDFKEKHIKVMGCPETQERKRPEREIVDTFFKQDIPDKIIANIKNEGEWTSKCIPRLLETTFHDFVTECMWAAIKKFKCPRVDFKVLRKFIETEVKELYPNIF